jgi:ComF family protein
MQILETAARAGRELVSVLLPSPCVVCGGELPVRSRRGSCCEACWLALPKNVPPRCERCALPWNTTAGSAPFTCADCIADPPPLDWIDAWGLYERGLAELLQAFKFRGHDFLARHLGQLLGDAYDARGDFDFDVIAPVPIHASRRRSRGFNQAALLAEMLSRAAALPMDERLLAKREERAPQAGLPKAGRRANARGAYGADARVAGKRVLLVDDISTTGETLRACALELTRQKAKRVAAIVVAKTP